MPMAMIPPGYRAYLLGRASSLSELGGFVPLEEGQPEGALMLARLDFLDFPPPEALSELNDGLAERGVPPWPGQGFIVSADTTRPVVYLRWQKGAVWMPIIVGLLASLVLPPLLTAGIWLILPEAVKSLVSGLIGMGMMMLVIFLVIKMLPALLPAGEKPKEIEERVK